MKTIYQITVDHDTVLPNAESYFFTIENALQNKLIGKGVMVTNCTAEIMPVPYDAGVKND